MPVNLLLVGLGGALGSIARYLVSSWAQTAMKNATFPYGTLAVNLFGCLVIGFMAQLAETRGVFTPESRALVFFGLLGGFTTFSTFGNETFNLARGGEGWSALANIGANVVIGLLAVWLGRSLAYLIWK
ncbi:MAG: fluoride efflux transporter CrcB [Anaerolineales bacterium]